MLKNILYRIDAAWSWYEAHWEILNLLVAGIVAIAAGAGFLAWSFTRKVNEDGTENRLRWIAAGLAAFGALLIAAHLVIVNL